MRHTRWWRLLRPLPYPRRAAELEEQQILRWEDETGTLKALEAAGTLRTVGQRFRYLRQRNQALRCRELEQMTFLPMIVLTGTMAPLARHVGPVWIMIALLVAIPLLDPLLTWIGSWIVPRGGFNRWQYILVLVASWLLILILYVVASKVFGHGSPNPVRSA